MGDGNGVPLGREWFWGGEKGVLCGGMAFRVAEICFLRGGMGFGEAKHARSVEEWLFGRLKCASCGVCGGYGRPGGARAGEGWNCDGRRGIWLFGALG